MDWEGAAASPRHWDQSEASEHNIQHQEQDCLDIRDWDEKLKELREMTVLTE